MIEDLGEVIKKINCTPITINQSERLNTTLAKQEKELEKFNYILDSMYVDLKLEIITKDEYLRMKSNYSAKKEMLQTSIDKLEAEIQIVEQCVSIENTYFTAFLKHQNILNLNRELLVDLIDIISLHENGILEIKFNFENKYKYIIEFIGNNA